MSGREHSLTDRQNDKDMLRKAVLQERDALSAAVRLSKSRAIAGHGASALAESAASKNVSGFYPIRSEADVRLLLSLLEDAGARLSLPAVVDRQTIVFRRYRFGETLVPGGFGTFAPGEIAEVVDPDILLMPLSVFDYHGNRIGYGAGHYDRAIARLHMLGKKPLLVGVAFDLQGVADVPAEPHDVPLDAIITESGVQWFSEPKSGV